MAYRGDYAPGDILYFNFTTIDTSASPAVPYTATGLVVSIYKDDSTTQSTAGITLTYPFDSIVGAVNIKVDTSADGTFYAAGHHFQAIITTGTVNGLTLVGYPIQSFTLQATSGGGGSAPTAAAIRVEMDTNSTRLAAIDLRGSRTTIRGTVSGTGPTTTQFTCATLEVPGITLNQFVPRLIVWDKDTTTTGLRGTTTDIRSSSIATLPLFTYTAIPAVPQAGDSFTIE